MTRKSKRNTIIAVCTGTLVLSTAALANYSTTNGYDTLKQSLLSTQDYTNCTITGNVEVAIDDMQFEQFSSTMRLDAENQLCEEINSYKDDSGYHILYDDKHAYHWSGDDFEGFYMYETNYFRNNLWGVDEGDKDTAAKAIKFAEVFADTVIGDIKNNFVCVDETDEYSSYTVSVDAVQMPPLVTAGFDLIASSIASDANESFENEMERAFYELASDVQIKNATLDFNVNKDGSPRDAKLVMTFTGGGHTLTSTVDLTCSDIGTTVVEKPEGLDKAVENYEYEYPRTEDESAEIYYED